MLKGRYIVKKEILKLIEKETKGKCFASQKYCIDSDDKLPLVYDNEKEIIPHESGETEENRKTIPLKNRANILLEGQPLFKYFLDGSRRVYKVDDILYDDKVYPIIVGQVGVGCCKRENKEIKKHNFLRENIIVLPIIANPYGGNNTCFFDNVKKAINEQTTAKSGIKINVDQILFYTPKDGKDDKDLAVTQIQMRMCELEKEMVSLLVKSNCLNDNSYLIKDGSLEYQKPEKGSKYEYAKIRINYSNVIGVSKSFNPSLIQLKNKDSMAKSIVDLQPYHRTPAIKYNSSHSGEKFAVWYLRIRPIAHCSSPFDGVVKVEKLLTTDKEQRNGLDSEVINNISAGIINERNPVCYGNDTRWGNHLYPIYTTETFVKSKYLSTNYFLNMF